MCLVYLRVLCKNPGRPQEGNSRNTGILGLLWKDPPVSSGTLFLNWAKSFSIAMTFSAREAVALAAVQCFTGNYFI